MNTRALDTDILIVGAGPVGLFLANECARRNLRWQIVEARPTQSEHSKALAIFPRTLEIFDMAGLAGPFLKAANRVTTVSVTSHERVLARMRFVPEETPYPFVAMVPQDVTEKLLVEELRRKGGLVEYETEFMSATQQRDCVSVVLDQRGRHQERTAAVVVGCDGARSVVRHQLGLVFEGGEYADSFMLADVETNETFPGDEMLLCPSEFGPVAIFPMSTTRRRVIAVIDQQQGDAPSLELVQKVLAQRAPKGMEARSLHWSTYFRIHHRHVGNLRIGRMFVAGDAAHIHSPFGGQGMNTGLHDVWNLVWKLDLFLRGLGNEQLLDSYSEERLPVIKSVIETTDFLTKVMGTPHKFVQVLRDTVIPMVSRLAPFQHAFVQRLSELGISYSGSPIVEGAGNRYLDESMRGGNGIRSRFLLLLADNASASAKDAAKQLATTFAETLELGISSRAGVTLVRPDGYIAYSGHDHDDFAELKAVRDLMERQTNSSSQAKGLGASI